jgi:hypothetical protein
MWADFPQDGSAGHASKTRAHEVLGAPYGRVCEVSKRVAYSLVSVEVLGEKALFMRCVFPLFIVLVVLTIGRTRCPPQIHGLPRHPIPPAAFVGAHQLIISAVDLIYAKTLYYTGNIM